MGSVRFFVFDLCLNIVFSYSSLGYAIETSSIWAMKLILEKHAPYILSECDLSLVIVVVF